MLVYNYYQKNNKIIQCKGITISYRNNLLNNNKIKFNLDLFIQFESCHRVWYRLIILITSLKLYLIVTLFVNFNHNFHKENETFSKKKLKRFKEKSLKMEPFLSELPYHIYD